MRISYKGTVALAIVVLEISLWSIFLQIGGSSIGILPELFYGFLIGSVVSVSLSLAKDRGKGLLSIVKDPSIFTIMLVAGLLNDIFTQLFLGIGTLGTNPAIGAIVFRSWIIFAALLTPLILKQKVSVKQFLATLVGFLGVYVILSNGSLFSFNTAQAPFIGILLMAAGCSTFSILIMNKYNVDTAGAVAIFNVASFIVASIMILITHTSLNVAFTPVTTLSILFLGTIAYGVGTMLYYYSTKILGPLITGNSIIIVPFLTIVLSFLIIGTQIKVYYILAALLAGIGVMLQRRYSLHPERIMKSSGLKKLQIFDVTGAFVNNSSKEIGSSIRGSNRAFAVKLNSMNFDEEYHSAIFSKRNCIAFTNTKPHRMTQTDEMDFINDIMGLKNGGTALIGIGNPKSLENSFEEFVAVSLASKQPATQFYSRKYLL